MNAYVADWPTYAGAPRAAPVRSVRVLRPRARGRPRENARKVIGGASSGVHSAMRAMPTGLLDARPGFGAASTDIALTSPLRSRQIGASAQG